MRSEFILGKDQSLPSLDTLGFGKYYVPYMYLRRFRAGQWETANVLDYQLLEIDPAANVLHYGQAIFEGMKGYYNQDQDKYFLFRPEQNAERYIVSARRICMPDLPVDAFVESVIKAMQFSRKWIPPYSRAHPTGASLYIRPFMIGTSPKLGVKPSDHYAHMVITSPSGPYFPTGMKPIKLKVETEYVRAVPGGTGNAKVAGNYAASMLAGANAQKEGYAQVLWLDAIEHRFLEEVGAMNVFVVMNDKLHVPLLSGSILPGITRQSIIELASEVLGLEVEERHIAIEEVIDGIQSGVVTELFGSGTAAVITPVGLLGYEGADYTISMDKVGPCTKRLYDLLVAIQYGEEPIGYEKGWTYPVDLT
ncbi:branched-chain amino acid aminotransferase [bacterium]|nr:branched-chain amino acid aminotransferase [candidate division CSSED10-310 bacterium]